ncbi:DUF6069 family protein [Pseudonocardia nigra]|uniref:DUF6069 family protein n=1 Tax=Pseudonocardia nigra TaxID=1921578 RepID=UPI001C5DED79|nr:DUF6069 family protein [Pseudonocardia nigra]
MTTTSTTSTAPSPLRRRALAVLGGTATALAVWAVAVPVAGVDLLARTGPEPAPVAAGAVAVAALVTGLAGWALLAVLERTTARPGRIWRVLATAVLLLSLLGPLAQGVGAAAVATLAALHVVVGAVLIPLLPRR